MLDSEPGDKARKYYERTSDRAPSFLLTRAVKIYAKDTGEALDLGCGAFRDTKYLLLIGFSVTAVDKRSLVRDYAENLPSDRFRLNIADIKDFDYGIRNYDLINAHFSIPFNSKNDVRDIFSKIKRSLKPGGMFVGNLLGLNDEWYGDADKSFHTLQEARELVEGLEIIELSEIEKDGSTADGKPKHWHFIDVIAQKPTAE